MLLAAPRSRAAAPRHGGRRRVIRTLAASAAPTPRKRPEWPVTLCMQTLVTVPVQATSPPDAGCELPAYMALPVSHYTLLELPLRATLCRVPATERLFALTIPRVRLFTLTVQPTITVRVDVLPPGSDARGGPCVLISAQDARVDGAWSDQLGLNARFEIYGDTRFTVDGDAIRSDTDLRVGVDPPDPFSRIRTCASRPRRLLPSRASTHVCVLTWQRPSTRAQRFWRAWATRCWAPSARSSKKCSCERWLRTTAAGRATARIATSARRGARARTRPRRRRRRSSRVWRWRTRAQQRAATQRGQLTNNERARRRHTSLNAIRQ
jgi:hypothetical protein